MAIKIGTKVRINTPGKGAAPDEMGTHATIIEYVEDTDEKYYKQGAYYLNPPIGNNKQYTERALGWGISNEAFAVLGGKDKTILKNTYFVITDFGHTNEVDRTGLALNTVFKQDFAHSSITPINPASVSSPAPNFNFGYGESAKRMNTRMRYATREEMKYYNQKGGPVYIGNRKVSSFKTDNHIPIGHYSAWDGVSTSELIVDLNLELSNSITSYINTNDMHIGSDPAIRDATDLFIRSGDGQVAMLTGSSGASFIDAPETKEQRLEKLTQGITMAKPVVIPVKKKSIKRLV